MADVWLLVDLGEGNGEWKNNIKAAVLPNKKVLGAPSVTGHINKVIKDAEKLWNLHHSEEGEVPMERIYGSLGTSYKNHKNMGIVIPLEEAREYIKQSGGL
jgi:hypothetical protein